MINLSKKQWGGALLVSLLALSLVLAGCSEPEVVGSDISGTWAGSGMATGITCTFNPDGTCVLVYPDTSSSPPVPISMDGTWSLNGETVGIDASYSDSSSGTDMSITLTCTYDDSATPATLTAKSGTLTMDGVSIDIPANTMTLQKQ